MNRSTVFGSATLLLAVSVSLTLMFHHFLGSSRASVEPYFFRFKVGLTYKGKPIDADIVVGCGVHDTFSRAQGGSTNEVLAMTAATFVLQMPEGHAVGISALPNDTAQACHGATTSDGDIPADWLPLISWYEHEDDLSQGIGYFTQDAYNQPDARFGFRGASIEKATAKDYQAFLTSGPRNLRPSYLADWMTHSYPPSITDKGVDVAAIVKQPTKAWPYAIAPGCDAVRRIRLEASQRAVVREKWPADHPEFWTAPTAKEQSEWYRGILTDEQRESALSTFHAGAGEADREIYPIDSDLALRNVSPATPADGRYVERILIDPPHRGRVFCDAFAPSKVISLVTGRPEILRRDRIKCRIGQYDIPDQQGCTFYDIVIQRDEYAIVMEARDIRG